MRILRRPEVINAVGLSTATIYRMMAESKFPKPVKLGARSVGWLESDIQAWLEQRIEASNAA